MSGFGRRTWVVVAAAVAVLFGITVWIARDPSDHLVRDRLLSAGRPPVFACPSTYEGGVTTPPLPDRLVPQGAAAFQVCAYTPLNTEKRTPSTLQVNKTVLADRTAAFAAAVSALPNAQIHPDCLRLVQPRVLVMALYEQRAPFVVAVRSPCDTYFDNGSFQGSVTDPLQDLLGLRPLLAVPGASLPVAPPGGLVPR